MRYFPIVGHGPHSYQADLMFLDADKGYTTISCITNVMHHKICILCISTQKTKMEEETTLSNIKKFFKEAVPDIIEHLQTDRGKKVYFCQQEGT